MSDSSKTRAVEPGRTGFMSHASLDRARRFLVAEGRLLERRIAEVLFDGAAPGGVLDALRGYRNEDGGYGNALEPDKRVAASQPLDVEAALSVMETAGVPELGAVLAACDFLAGIGPGVGCLTAAALECPRAPHWGSWALEPSLNPTAGIVARLWRWEIDHPWRDEATAFCWRALQHGLPQDAHTFGEVLEFLSAVDDRERADAWTARLAPALPSLALFRLDPSAEGYGMTPLHFVRDPSSPWAALFDRDVVESHLNALGDAQEDDGGWPISWDTVGPAARQEWRGIETLRAVRTLAAFQRLT